MATLYDLAMRYLQQGLPSISGIFPATIPPIGGTPPPTTPDPTQPGQSQGIVNAGGGDNFSVYNPDPNRTRTGDDYSPFAFRQAQEKTFYDTPTAANKAMDMYPDYYGVGQKTGIERLLSKLPGQRILKGIKDLLPVNNRAILENELLGQGFQIDDIGRIVTNDYNTPEGIMAGYNASRMTRQTFDKRIDTINKTIAKKKAKGEDTSVLENRIDLIEQAKDKFLGGSGKATTVFNEALKQKDIDKGFINDQGITYDDAYLEEKDIIEQIIEAQKTGKPIPGITTGPFSGLSFAPGMGFGVSPLGEMGTGISSITSRPNIIEDMGQQNIQNMIEASKQRKAEAAAAAAGGDRQRQAMQAVRDQQRKNRAYREDIGPGPGSYGPGGGSGIQRDSGGTEVGYNDPFDPGGGE
jgi:hypothetical protein